METKKTSRRDVLKVLAALGVAATESGFAAAQDAKTSTVGGKIVFENDKVRVIEHVARPRIGVCGIGWHSHPPHLTLALTDIKAKVTLKGKDSFLAENKAGDAFWDPGGEHIVENVGSRDSKTYLIELKGPA